MNLPVFNGEVYREFGIHEQSRRKWKNTWKIDLEARGPGSGDLVPSNSELWMDELSNSMAK